MDTYTNWFPIIEFDSLIVYTDNAYESVLTSFRFNNTSMLKLTLSTKKQQQPATFSYQFYTDLEVYRIHRYDLHFLVLVNLYASIYKQ